MNPDLQKSIEDQIENLPHEIKKLVLSDEWRVWVGNIVKKNTLNLDQASSLEHEIFVFLIGLVNVFDLRKSIQTELNIPVSKVNDIMIDINDVIIEPLKEKLMNETSDEADVPSKVSTPLAQTIVLKQKEEEILDRQKVLSEIEEVSHAPGVGVYVPDAQGRAVEVNKVQPITQNAQILAPQAKPMLTAEQSKTNIFDTKTSEVVAPVPKRTVAEIVEPKPARPAGSTDIYREPIA